MGQIMSPVGLQSPPRSYILDPAWIQQFDRAIPGWDESPAPSTQVNIPLSFAAALTPAPIAGLLLPAAGLIHGEQRFRYGAPMEVGMKVTVVNQVTGYKVRGQTAFITLTTRGQADDGRMLFEAESLLLAPQSEEDGTNAD